ncbi:hypothetical protein C1E23_18820 [Pseudoalteromonas phenolica]|uniref:Uncharacterized protein n=1 Tax=Pseudoalteromonas phenolica TaxID=161398 RepID=A0A4Q7IIA8_9GAMM|nr:hypothetical protein C1E23_18820 [Pseudoalteromonas phenolica]
MSSGCIAGRAASAKRQAPSAKNITTQPEITPFKCMVTLTSFLLTNRIRLAYYFYSLIQFD